MRRDRLDEQTGFSTSIPVHLFLGHLLEKLFDYLTRLIIGERFIQTECLHNPDEISLAFGIVAAEGAANP